MIDKKIFQFMLDKLNNTSINTQGVKFKGNYVFVRVNDNLQLLEASTYNPYDTVLSDFVAMAETVSQPTDYVEANNRTGWVKQYTFQFDVRNKDTVLEALQETYNYLKVNNVQEIVDDETYKFVLKPTRATFVGNQQGAGTVFTTYSMNLFAETIETGFYGDEAVHKMAKFGLTPNEVIMDSVTVGSAVSMDVDNDITENANTGNEPIARGVSLQFVLNYKGTALEREIRQVIEGKEDREKTYVYQKEFDTATETWTFRIVTGNVVYKKGGLIQLAFNGVEV